MIDRLGRVIFESDTNDSLSKVKAIVSKIRDHVKRTAKPPTGNQNCQLCTWCTEAHMRGFDVLPRPVYSPRDPVFNIKGESIVKNPIRQSLGSGLRSGIENLLDLTEIEGGRWYCHVNWHGSQGGHEFILMRISKVLYVVDSQQGLVTDALSKRGGEYFNDINWGNSYIVRLDDKEFNEEMFMKNNDPSQTLPWNEDLDIPYMRENGMLPDEDINEAKVERINDEGDTVPEKCDKCGSHVGLYLKGEPVWLCSNKKCGKYFGTAPCNFQESTLPDGVFLRPANESDLPNIIKWKLESVNPKTRNDPKTIRFIENDAKENLKDTKMIMSYSTVIGVLESCYIDDGEWWYIGEIYLIPEYRGKGIARVILQQEIDSHDKLKLRVSKDNTHAIDLYKSLGFGISEEDEYAYTMTLVKDNMQEFEFLESDHCELFDESDKMFLKNLADRENRINPMVLRNFGKQRLQIKDDEMYIKLERHPENLKHNIDVRCNQYFKDLFTQIKNSISSKKWLTYESLIKKLFNVLGLEYSKNRTCVYWSPVMLAFKEKEYEVIQYDPSTDVLVHASPVPNLMILKPSHYARDGGAVYPTPRIYFKIIRKSELKNFNNSQYGKNIYVYAPLKPIEVSSDRESNFGIQDKYSKAVFINTKIPIKVVPIDQYINNSNPAIQEAATDNCNKMIPVTNFKFNKVYYGDPIKRINHMTCDDGRPLFTTPYIGLASIFSGRYNLRKILREKGCRRYNLGYDEWGLDLSKLKEPLSEVHVRVEGYPDLESFTCTFEGYIHTIDVSNIKHNLYQYPWMTEGREVLIANMKEIPIEKIEKVKVTYIVSGAESRNTFQEGVLNDLKNGVNPYSTKRVFHISRYGHFDGQVFKPRVPEYLDKYDPNYPNFEDVDNPRVCFSPSIEGCLNAIVVNVERWKADRFDKLYVYVPEKPIDQYKHTTNKQIIKDKKVYDANLTREVWIEEPVRLKMYGVIKVDQISDVKKKSTVPMLNGKKGERNYYSYKWHWLIKPKVLDKVPYDYSPTAVCEDMVRDLKRYAYGIPVNGKIQNVPSSEYFDKHYRLLSPDEFEKYGGGVCWDYVEFMEGYLDAYGYSCKKYYISTDTKDGDTHTFITVDDGEGGLLYPESSFKLIEGLHKVKNVEEAIKMITSKMFEVNNNSKKYSEIKYYVWEYTGHPEYGSNCVQCTEYFSKGEPFYEGTAINPNKQKIVKESVRMSYPDRFGNNTMTRLSPRMTTDDTVVQEGMFDAGFSNLRMKIAKALEGRFKVTNVYKAMGGKDKFDIVSEDTDDGTKTSVESTGNGCKVVSRGMGKMKSHFNNISLSAAFDRIISLFERPEVLLEGALPCSFRTFMEADDDSDDDSVDLNSFGSDNDGSSPNNQYDEEEVSRLNELISDENHAVGQYFEAAKTTNNEVLRRLFSDIGNEERFHTEQLLYAKSTITGEKYEPMDKDVKKEYEELLAMGMDEEDAFNTAIDKQHFNAEDDGDDSDMEELEVDTKALGESFQYYTGCIELCEIITESDLFESGSEAIRNSMIVMESVLYMEEVGPVDQQKNFLKNNPITFIIKGFLSFIKFIKGLVDKIKIFISRIQTKQHRMHEWIKRNGIKQLFANGINMYFYDDRDLKHVKTSALLYCDMLCRIVELIAKDMGLNFQSRHKINDTSKTVQFDNVDDGLREFKKVVFSKTKIVVNENNEQKLAELFFGYSYSKLPTGKSVNIYHTLDMVANEVKKASEEVNNFITSVGALDKDLNSIYYKDPKKYRLGVDRLNKVYKGLTIIGKALASDMNEVLKLNNGLLEKTRAADANDMGINPNNNN